MAGDARRRRSSLILGMGAVSLVAVTATTQQPGAPLQPRRGPEIGEPPDVALRRLQALHDMYAAPEDQAEYDRRRRIPEGSGQAARPLPINFGGADENFRLRALRERGSVLRGSLRRLPTESSAPDP